MNKVELSLLDKLLAVFLILILKLWSLTIRVSYDNRVKEILSNKGIYTLWHESIISSLLAKKLTGTALVSPSRDGRLLQQILPYFNIKTVLGSSSRGGAIALIKMIRRQGETDRYLIAIDGPKGPAYQAKEGGAFLGKVLKRPVYPIVYKVSSFWRINSWDRHIFPKPFSTITICIGDPIINQEDLTKENITNKLCSLMNLHN